MEQGMIGQCIDETRIIRMPPQWGYDDPHLNFDKSRKPVPTGSTVNYQITVHEVRRPGTLSYFWITAVQQGGVPGFIFLVILMGVIYSFYDSYSKEKKRGKKRR